MRISDWVIVIAVHNPYAAPETRSRSLHGRVFGSPIFNDGDLITTSSIRGQRRGKVVTSSGSSYELGQPNLSYEEKFPGAKSCLMDGLPIV